ncbi:hypothetical protein D3C87_1778910 [compost metagenome]
MQNRGDVRQIDSDSDARNRSAGLSLLLESFVYKVTKMKDRELRHQDTFELRFQP